MEYIEENKKNIIILGILIGLLIIFGIINKITDKKQYVETIKKSNNSKLAYINIENESIQELNSRLEEQYNEIVNLNNDSYMTYEYSKNGNILSLLITRNIKLNDEYIPDEIYSTYNIDLKTNKVLGNDDIYELYKIDKEDTESKIVNDLANQYNSEVNNGYIVGQECDINCYLEDKEYYSIDDNFNLYIQNNKVYGFLNVSNASVYYTINNYPKMNKKYELN